MSLLAKLIYPAKNLNGETAERYWTIRPKIYSLQERSAGLTGVHLIQS
jgi:hypothetical protein